MLVLVLACIMGVYAFRAHILLRLFPAIRPPTPSGIVFSPLFLVKRYANNKLAALELEREVTPFRRLLFCSASSLLVLLIHPTPLLTTGYFHEP